MPEFTSKAGVVVTAHVVTEQERSLTVPVDGGHDHLGIGDALVTIKGQKNPYVVRAAVFDALFAAAAPSSARQPQAEPQAAEPAEPSGSAESPATAEPHPAHRGSHKRP
jgi:hypothetical protein